MTKVKRETSKALLWTIITLSAVFCAAALIVCAALARDQLGVAITVIGGLWSAAVPVAIGFYETKSQAENVLKISQNAEIEALRSEIETLRAEMPVRKAPRKKSTDELAGQLRMLLENYQNES